MNYVSRICSGLLGLVFAVSAVAKAVDGARFASILQQYGAEWFSVVAPAIVLVEAVLAVLLILHIRPRLTSAAAMGFLLSVTLIFTYGLLFRHIRDCGCFGRLHALNTRPALLYVRNGVFFLLALPSLCRPAPSALPALLRRVAPAVLVLFASACTFLCGLTMAKSFGLPTQDDFKTDVKPVHVSQLALTDLFTTSPDSTYMLFFFSFTCPHCMDTYANVEQYQQMRVVDRVIGIAVDDPEGEAFFRTYYQPSISVYTISPERMERLVRDTPVAFMIEGDTIRSYQAGHVITAGAFIH